MNDVPQFRRRTAKDFPQELLELYDYYVHGRITKREFLDRAAKFAAAGVTAAVLLNQLSPDYARPASGARRSGSRDQSYFLRFSKRQRQSQRLPGTSGGS